MQDSSASRKFSPTAWLFGFTIVAVFLLSFKEPRAFIAMPLCVHDASASADAAYVMSGGPASFERLLAASDLFHQDRVGEIILLNEQQSSTFNFILQRSETRIERCISYLMMRGVPRDRISSIQPSLSTTLGSLREARGITEQRRDLTSLVVVTSPIHTRRCKLAFERSLPSHVKLKLHAASSPTESDEIFSPIWIEYMKLFLYYMVA
jgi:uncharacterized SAM-binding protein YcdF (DUF218 family)